MYGLTVLVSFCLQYTYSHTVARHFTRAEELEDKVGNEWIRELAYDTFVDCAGLCFKDETCCSFSFYSGACYRHISHSSSLYDNSTGMKTFFKKVSGICPCGYRLMGDTCVMVYDTPIPNAQARSRCQQDGGDLMAMTTGDKLTRLVNHMQEHGIDITQRRTVGGHLDTSQQWKWIDGSQVDVTQHGSFWCQSEPNFLNTQKCMHLSTNSTCFKNNRCDRERGYVCEVQN
ncbi:type-2 ice-structuring protein-like [Haliotis rubra]|uniref:type-2 ice-structuring protein-like n=1 Tax=Haliotis rubra TaxID=36100 RepID=UPI001EE5F334|nr:type-2 ice-structuring protein-like [Haliotis rubra]